MSPIIVGGRSIFGALSSQPTGITTTAGSEYYDTTLNLKRVYRSTGWVDISVANVETGDEHYDSVVLHLTGNSPTEEVSRYGHTVTASNATTASGKFGNGIGLEDILKFLIMVSTLEPMILQWRGGCILAPVIQMSV